MCRRDYSGSCLFANHRRVPLGCLARRSAQPVLSLVNQSGRFRFFTAALKHRGNAADIFLLRKSSFFLKCFIQYNRRSDVSHSTSLEGNFWQSALMTRNWDYSSSSASAHLHIHMHIHITWGVCTPHPHPPLRAFAPHAHLN